LRTHRPTRGCTRHEPLHCCLTERCFFAPQFVWVNRRPLDNTVEYPVVLGFCREGEEKQRVGVVGRVDGERIVSLPLHAAPLLRMAWSSDEERRSWKMSKSKAAILGLVFGAVLACILIPIYCVVTDTGSPQRMPQYLIEGAIVFGAAGALLGGFLGSEKTAQR
jgi:hypothetical protein